MSYVHDVYYGKIYIYCFVYILWNIYICSVYVYVLCGLQYLWYRFVCLFSGGGGCDSDWYFGMFFIGGDKSRICMSWSMKSPASPPAIIFFLNWLMNFTLWNEWIWSLASLSLKLRSLTSADSVISDYMENYLLEFLPMVPLFLIFRSSEWDIPFLGSW